ARRSHGCPPPGRPNARCGCRSRPAARGSGRGAPDGAIAEALRRAGLVTGDQVTLDGPDSGSGAGRGSGARSGRRHS
ncbi:hypothetical protein ND747_16115, partial [Frankia sp. R82]